jgi:hypothetical protein
VRLVRDAGIGGGQPSKAKTVESEVGDHDGQDQTQHQDGFAVGFQPRRPRNKATIEAVEHCQCDGHLDAILEGRKGPAEGFGPDERLVVADGQQLHLADQQRHEAQEDHRVHQPGAPFTLHHALLQEAVDQHAAQPLAGPIPAHQRLQGDHDGQLAPAQPDEPGHAQQHEQADANRTHSRSPIFGLHCR